MKTDTESEYHAEKRAPRNNKSRTLEFDYLEAQFVTAEKRRLKREQLVLEFLEIDKLIT